MKKGLIMATGLLVIAASTNGQTKKTTFYPNGNKEFEGDYRLAYSVNEIRDQYNFDTATDKRRAMTLKMRNRMPERNANVQKVYNGKCTFYFDNGKVSYTGNYANGVKDGQFSYSYYNGAKEAEHKYANGMADGKAISWYPNGKTWTELQYEALTDAELDSLYKAKTYATAPNMGNPFLMEHNRLHTYVNDTLRKSAESSLWKFAELENSFASNSHWNGDFITYYENGSKCTEMHYKNDVRTGKWNYYSDSGKLYVTLTFTEGKIASVVNNMPADLQSMSRQNSNMADRAAMMRPEFRDSMRNAMMLHNGGMGSQRPTASVDVNKYIKDNLKYPESAAQKKLQGVVMVKFNVNEDGSTADYEVVKPLCPECDEEAKRLIKSMPAWKPAMNAGKPVKMSNMVPVPFNLKEGKK